MTINNETATRRLFIETYGCQMNVADSEVVASILGMAGYEMTESVEDADAILLNTCSIRDNAEQKILSRLTFLASLRRRRGRQRRLIVGVIGCMAERVRDSLINEHGVDGWPVLMHIFRCPNFSPPPRPATRPSMSSCPPPRLTVM